MCSDYQLIFYTLQPKLTALATADLEAVLAKCHKEDGISDEEQPVHCTKLQSNYKSLTSSVSTQDGCLIKGK